MLCDPRGGKRPPRFNPMPASRPQSRLVRATSKRALSMFRSAPSSAFRFGMRSLALGLSLSMVATSMPAWALQGEKASQEEAAASTTTGGRVAVLRFTGDKESADSLRGFVASELEGLGFTVGGIRVSMADAAKKNKCEITEADCLKRIGTYVNKNAKQPFNFYVYADTQAATPTAGQSRLMVFDIDKGAVVSEIVATPTPNDQMLLNAMVSAMRTDVARYQTPLPELSAEERAKLDNPGDPEKTAEEAAEEERILAESQKKAAADAKKVAVSKVDDINLKRDFKEFCRTGPRKDTEVRDIEGKVTTERDYSPPCKRGPFFGYWQPRSYALAAATGVSLLASLGLYGMSIAARGKYNTAKSNFENKFGTDASAKKLVDQQKDLFDGRVCNSAKESDCYLNLAGEVSETGHRVRKFALYGDIALGVSVVLAGITALSVFQDRNDAKKYLRERRALKLSNLRVAPIFGGGRSGAAASMRF